MSTDGTAEQDAYKTRLSTLLDGNVHDPLPEEAELPTQNGMVMPYIVVSYSTVSAAALDRSIEGEAQQPVVMVVIVECWAVDYDSARITAGAVRTLMIGYEAPGGNATELALTAGGRWFEQKDASGRPTRNMVSVALTTTFNMSIEQPA